MDIKKLRFRSFFISCLRNYFFNRVVRKLCEGELLDDAVLKAEIKEAFNAPEWDDLSKNIF